MRENPILCFTAIVFLLMIITTKASIHCNPSCPSYGRIHFPYPFGFSAGCAIRLNCTDKDGIFIGEFPVQSINSESIRISLQSRCNRSLHTLRQLYSLHHAPTSRNAILLRNCTDEQASSSCEIPSMKVEARFQAPPDCSKNTSLSCVAESKKNATFLDYDTVYKKGCKYLLSSISASVPISNDSQAPPLTLEVEVAELGWWLNGPCTCHKNANCTRFLTPNGSEGYRCNCKKGFIGDGFQAGLGCRKG